MEPISTSEGNIPAYVETETSDKIEENPPQEKSEKSEETMARLLEEEKALAAKIAREAKNLVIGKTLSKLLDQMKTEEEANYPLWGETFISILKESDKLAYAANKETFHEVIDLLTSCPAGVKPIDYFTTLYDVAYRLTSFDVVKAGSLIKEYYFATNRIPALIQKARIALDAGKAEEALPLLQRAKELTPFHTTWNPLLKNSCAKEKSTFIQEIAELEKQIDPNLSCETLSEFTRTKDEGSYLNWAMITLSFLVGVFVGRNVK